MTEIHPQDARFAELERRIKRVESLTLWREPASTLNDPPQPDTRAEILKLLLEVESPTWDDKPAAFALTTLLNRLNL